MYGLWTEWGLAMRRRRIRISIFVRLFTKSVAAGPYQLNPTQLKVVKSTQYGL